MDAFTDCPICAHTWPALRLCSRCGPRCLPCAEAWHAALVDAARAVVARWALAPALAPELAALAAVLPAAAAVAESPAMQHDSEESTRVDHP